MLKDRKPGMRLQEVLKVKFLPAGFTGPKVLPRCRQTSFVVLQRRNRDSGKLQALGALKKTRQACGIGHAGAPSKAAVTKLAASLPWIGGRALCYPPFLQVVGLRRR